MNGSEILNSLFDEDEEIGYSENDRQELFKLKLFVDNWYVK